MRPDDMAIEGAADVVDERSDVPPSARPRRVRSLAVFGAMTALAAMSLPEMVPMPEVPDRLPRVVPSRNQRPRVPGNQRNEPCDCGCGLKRKRCPRFV